MSLVNSKNTLSVLSDDFVQNGSNIDVEIAVRLSRCIWKALAQSDPALCERLNGHLHEEIESIVWQHEIDASDGDDRRLAVAHLLRQYLTPTP